MLAMTGWLAACGAEGGLTTEDVENIPAGTGTGSTASGDYELELFTRDCIGLCPVIESGFFTISLCDVNDGNDADVTVVQTDGALVMDADGLVVERLTGGIDLGGGFTVGGWGTESGVTTIVKSTGTLDGNTFTGTAEARGVGTVHGEVIDCTALYDVTGTRGEDF